LQPGVNGNEAANNNAASPETGDNSSIAIWIAVMFAAGAALTGAALYSRKKK
jgi:LPXTG-motif cell wall-anchored protein